MRRSYVPLINAASSEELGAKLRARIYNAGFTQRIFVETMGLNETRVSRQLRGVYDSRLSTWIKIENQIEEFLSLGKG